MSRTQKFAHMLKAILRDGEVSFVHQDRTGPLPLAKRYWRVRGRLDIGATIARVEIWVPLFFRRFKYDPPLVRCMEPWMKWEVDWHNLLWLCWVLDLEWRDAMNWRGKPPRTILDEGLAWLRDAVTRLLSQHYLAHLELQDKWSSDWPAWSHGNAGRKEYLRTKAGQRSPLLESRGRNR